MRLYTIVSWIFILDPQWALISAQRTDRTPLCINIEEEGHLIPEQANTTVGPWAEREYQDWKENGANDESFWHRLHKKWAPDAADSIIKCDLSSMCSVVSCRLIDNRHDLQEQWNAYWTLESIATFHNVAYEIRKANMEAWSSVSNDVGTLVSRFSDGSNIEQHKLKHDRNWKVASHVICGVAMLVSGIGVFSTAFINAAPTLALVKGITAVISKEEIAMYAASAGLFNTGASVALNVGSDFMGPKNYVSKMTDTLKHSQMQNQDQIVDRFDAFVKGLLSEGSHGQRRSHQERDEAWTENDRETMFQFLNVTGFYRYGDWWGYCHGKGEDHGNHCRGNKNIDWTGKFGKSQYKKIRHPFKHCKARKGLQHSFVGCEGPNNNGYDNNKPSECAGRPGTEGFVAEDSTQWVNGAAYEADGMEEDEGEMSDWTDGEDEADADDDNDDFELHTPHDNKTGIASRFYA
ncbi:hypothetical protein E4T44_02143 [Aureobasidium sp. EXF-8845]|nr:hypothetical protein E4T44_02143 [Aureobasidium sp. EXF-8845]